MSDLATRNTPGAGDELLDILIRMVAVWGTGWMGGEIVNRLLLDVLPRGWRIGISLVVTLGIVAALLPATKLWPRFGRTFFAWRYPIALLLAGYVGYQWHIHDYKESEEARLNEAIRWACAKSQSCQQAAVNYLVGKETE
jgi:hypothetical protein